MLISPIVFLDVVVTVDWSVTSYTVVYFTYLDSFWYFKWQLVREFYMSVND